MANPSFSVKALAASLLITSGLMAGCNSDSDFSNGSFLSTGNLPANSVFDGVNTNDFVDSTGTSTALSQTIANCTVILDADNVCPTSTLPFIAYDTTEIPTKAQIMEKLVVSDQWMADNFSELLDGMPEDMYRLFGSTTAIVIHRNIRPAFFWGATGAIYLDPYYVWKEVEEWNSVSQEEDYRAAYARQIDISTFNRYTKNGVMAFGQTTLDRSTSEARYALSALLFHELAHAADAFPREVVANVSNSDTLPYELLTASDVSTQLNNQLPLTSQAMHELGQVLFQGAAVTDDVKSMTAADAGAHFDADGATDDYAYSTIYEDTAMMFEEIMMKAHYDVDREFGFAQLLSDNIETCSDLRVDYHVTNRYQDVIQRVEFVVDRLLPGQDYDSYYSNFPTRAIKTFCVPGVQSLTTPGAQNQAQSTNFSDQLITVPRPH